ncbi:flagellar hook-length control protein FliK [Frischella perrara]|uniref:Flagellar hook-length control protein n=1 Tax=Frischella perrara TaxID=1267021 RepID=A0A0A7S9C3_FRIPE|nr:flagellar hook-length control protein FliK [Frischella perrara]AJA45886.1 Flagellar hook-length control protein [Frischella perrara]PWV62578.1 flagellar hook-length control protein FliK [Frischella perrara]
MNLSNLVGASTLTSNQSNQYQSDPITTDGEQFKRLLQINEKSQVEKVDERLSQTKKNKQSSINDDVLYVNDMAMLINAISVATVNQPDFQVNSSSELSLMLFNQEQLVVDTIIDEEDLLLNQPEDDDFVNDQLTDNLLSNSSTTLVDRRQVKPKILEQKKPSGTTKALSNNMISSNQISNATNQPNLNQTFKLNDISLNQWQSDSTTNHHLLQSAIANNTTSIQSVVANSPIISLPVAVDQPQWQESLAQQIILFKRHNIEQAEIRLHPEELGSLQIKLSMHDGKMQLHMAAAVGVVKGILESALPYLRTYLAEQGIELQQTEVTDFTTMMENDQSSQFQQQFSASHQDTVNILSDNEVLLDPTLPKPNNQEGLSVFA